MKIQREKLQGKIEEIQTAWLIGLGYTVPPYNGQHSQEMFKQFISLFLSEWEKLIPEKRYSSLVITVNSPDGDEPEPSDYLNTGFNEAIDRLRTTLKQLEAEKKV